MAFPDDELDVLVEAFLGADPTADPGTWPSATDLSARLLDEPITITRGRASGQSTLSSGSCTFVLNNDEIGDGTGANAAGVLTPLLATSPYYGTWDLGVPVRISVTGVGSSPPYRRFCGFVADITATVVPGSGGVMHSAVRVTLGGVVRSLTQGSAEMSMLRRMHMREDAANLVAYWALDGGKLSTAGALTRAGTGITGTPFTPFSTGTTQFGAGDLGPWLEQGVVLSEVATMEATLSGMAASPSVVLAEFVCSAPGGGEAPTTWQLLGEDENTGNYWTITFTPGVTPGTGDVEIILLHDGVFVDSVTVTDSNPVIARFFTDGPHHIAFQAQAVAGDIVFGVSVDVSDFGAVVGDTFTSTPLTGWSMVRLSYQGDDGMTFGQAAVYVFVSATDLATRSRAARYGMAGDDVHDLIELVCDAEGIPYSSSAAFSQQAGYLPVFDAISAMRDLETTDHGMLTELRDTWGFGYVSGDERYNQAAALTIDLSTYRVSQGDSAAVLVPTRNDRRVRNEWTVTRRGGDTAAVADLDHQAKHGRYDDSAEVGLVDDTRPEHDAGWRVREGTVEGLRYSTIPLDIGANASALLQDWLDLDLGARIDRTNHPSPPHPHDDIAVTLEGYVETIRRKAWKANLVTEPYETWNVRELNEDTDPDANVFSGRWAEEEGTVLDEAIDTTDTSFDVDPNGGTWTTDDDEFDTDLGVGLYVEVGGERMQVTDIVDAGGGIYTFTVVRSINSVTKAHSAGAPLKVVDAQIWAL